MESSWTSSWSAIWILLSAWFVAGGIILSCIGQLNRTGNAILLAIGLAGSLYGYRKLSGTFRLTKGLRWRRFKKPFPLLYLICASAVLVGGALHTPTNYDAFAYRIPRILHWLAADRWHWIGGIDARMDFSSCGFEWLMLPAFATFQTLRFAFLINVISYVLLPGLIYSVFTALGVKRSIAATWMWILPCASCFVMEAGSIGNDFIATVYVLAALWFALRAIRSGRRLDVILSVFSAALMTGAKASNLPLLLPVAISLLVLILKRPKLIITTTVAGCVSVLISLIPLAVVNIQHTGDWAGDPNSLLKLKNPVIGVAGNTLQLVGGSLVPAVFPPADKVNQWCNQKLADPPMKWIKDGFPELRSTLAQMASEESSGLGLGVSAALFLGLLAARKRFRGSNLISMGGLVFGGFWVALLVYMMKLGNCSAPRLIAPYYIGLIGLPLLLIQSGKVFNAAWWRWCSLLALVPIIPALLLNPARPLLPMVQIVEKLKSSGINNATLSRMDVVYNVYATRGDAHQSVRALLPESATLIGFAGTGDESEYSFWLPLGSRQVRDFTPVADGKLPDISGLDAIVASEWGCNDRFKMTPAELARRLGWQIIGTAQVKNYAAADAAKWSVLLPPTPASHP